MFHSFRNSVRCARQQNGLYFAALLSEETINQAFGPARHLWQGWVYTPSVTVWVFLSQCLSADHSCRDAVCRLMAWMVSRGLKPCSGETSAYCSARNCLPEAACHALVRTTGYQLENEAPESWLWHGRRVRVVDGSTITMSDTKENQKEYPQLKGQRPGCGFPIARILVVFSLSVGAEGRGGHTPLLVVPPKKLCTSFPLFDRRGIRNRAGIFRSARKWRRRSRPTFDRHGVIRRRTPFGLLKRKKRGKKVTARK